MKRFFSTILLCFFLTGCSGFSLLHPFGTPVSSVQKAEVKQEAAEEKAGRALQEEVHKVDYAIDAAADGNPNGIPTAKSHSRTAKSLADQIFGPPTVVDETKWQDLIARQTSLDEKIRVIADTESAKRIGEIARLSTELEKKNASLETATKKAVDYAAELQLFKDRAMKVAWVIGGLIFLYFLGQILQFLAHFNPAFETAANVINTFVSPALHSAAHKARRAVSAAAS